MGPVSGAGISLFSARLYPRCGDWPRVDPRVVRSNTRSSKSTAPNLPLEGRSKVASLSAPLSGGGSGLAFDNPLPKFTPPAAPRISTPDPVGGRLSPQGGGWTEGMLPQRVRALLRQGRPPSRPSMPWRCDVMTFSGETCCSVMAWIAGLNPAMTRSGWPTIGPTTGLFRKI
jgi:hypothetical protein